VKPLEAFPFLMLVSCLGALGGSLLTPPEDEAVLIAFYMRTRPWGWWGPIQDAARRLDPTFEPNSDFARDAFNVLVGIVWQTSFVALPIYVVIKHWQEAAICALTIAVTTAILKRTWFDRLDTTEQTANT
jgi:hypothetical protein